MHAMPPPSPTPARRRLTFMRVLLAIVLGLAAWWGVGWWLSPRALWTLRLSARPSSLARPAPKYAVNFDGLAVPLDQMGRYLFVVPPYPAGVATYSSQIHDMATGKVLGHREFPAEEMKSPYLGVGPLAHGQALADQDGSLVDLRDHPEHPESRIRLWKDNLISGQQSLLKAWPTAEGLHINRDGTCLVELRELPTLSLLATLPRQALTVGVVLAADGTVCPPQPILARSWSLPDLRLQCSFVIPARNRYPEVILSSDGNWLVVAGASNRLANLVLRAGWRRAGDEEILVYDLNSGAMRVVVLPEGVPPDYALAEGSDCVRIRPTPPSGARDWDDRWDNPSARTRRLHLPSCLWMGQGMTWPAEATSAEPLGGNEYRFATYSSDQERLTIWKVTPGTNPQVLRELQGVRTTIRSIRLIPNSNQAVLIPYTRVGLYEPFRQWLRSWLVLDWLDWQGEAAIMDLRTGEIMWRSPYRGTNGPCSLELAPGGKQLLDVRSSAGKLSVNVLALPVANYSPWWSRTAGLLIAALVLVARRRSRGFPVA
jgi:hypothetical protein